MTWDGESYCYVDGCHEPATHAVPLARDVEALVCDVHAPDPDAVPYVNDVPEPPPTHELQPRDDEGHFQPLVLDPWGRVVVWADKL